MPVQPFTLVIFGITSNLAQTKLLPALYHLSLNHLLPAKIHIIGTARSPMSKKNFHTYLRQTLKQNIHKKLATSTVTHLLKNIEYINGQLDDPNYYAILGERLKKIKNANKIFYLATYPNLYADIFHNLKASHLHHQDKGWTRLMIEKPIGNDFKSAQALNQLLLKYFEESQIYRLDHYLGKETLQNILTFRFGNEIFEPLINNNFIDHIQITSAHETGVGSRGGYYDTVGALKDIGQNHLLQMLAFATMYAPSKLSNQEITKERLKVLENLTATPDDLVLGQYRGYLKEDKIKPGSKTDTYFAFKTSLKSERFQGVPMYVRGGMRLKKSISEIVIVFKQPGNRLFKHFHKGQEPNILIYRIQPNEGVVFKILTKKPAHQLEVEPEYMQFRYADSQVLPEAYERLLLDAIRGDQTFFNDAEEVEAEWRFIDKLTSRSAKVEKYTPGSWGPKGADQLIQNDGRSWLEPPEDFK